MAIYYFLTRCTAVLSPSLFFFPTRFLARFKVIVRLKIKINCWEQIWLSFGLVPRNLYFHGVFCLGPNEGFEELTVFVGFY